MQFELLQETQQNGYYLDFFQLYNWGVFDSRVYTLHCAKQSSLLTGLNGSGKTTIVDALISLLVPRNQRFYNQSAGAESKRERDESSYVLGTYGNQRYEEFTNSSAQNLRKKDSCYSILLGCFAQPTGQSPITLMQFRFFSPNGVLQHVYSITRKTLTIEEIQTAVGNFDRHGTWKKSMIEVFSTSFYGDSFTAYAAAFSQLIGLRSNKEALALFSKTAGLKGIGNLNEFIRTYMFEGQDIEKVFADFVQHFEELSQMYNEIEKAQLQMQLLQEVMEAGAAFEEQEKNETQLRRLKAVLHSWYTDTARAVIRKNIEQLIQERTLTVQKETAVSADIIRIEHEIESVQTSIAQNETSRRVSDIEHNLRLYQEKQAVCRKNLHNYSEWAVLLGLSAPDTEKTFTENYQMIPVLKKQLEEQSEQLTQAVLNARITIEKERGEAERLTAELASLSRRSSNIPAHTIRIREELCTGIGVSAAQLPFAGELLRVRKDASEWEKAIEKVLHHFALCILVPPELYLTVNRYVTAHNMNGRLVYLKTDTRSRLEQPVQQDSLVLKIDIKHTHPLSDWVKMHLEDQFDYLCTDDQTEFARADKAVTSTGLIKSKIRHEKDDRPQRDGKAFYVLGWDNLQKRQELSAALRTIQTCIDEAAEKITALYAESAAVQRKIRLADNLAAMSSWDECDTGKYTALIDHCLEEKAQLLQQDNTLQQLKQHVKNLEIAKKEKQKEHTECIAKKATADSHIQELEKRLSRLEEPKVSSAEIAGGTGEVSETARNTALFIEHFAIHEEYTALDQLDAARETYTVRLDRELEQAGKLLKKAEHTVREKMAAVKNPKPEIKRKFPTWETAVRDLQPEASFLQDFTVFYEQLLHDDLPAWRKKFKASFSENIQRDIINFNTKLDTGKQQIIAGIQELNRSLKTIPYNKNPATYIKLESRDAADKPIQEFRALLHAALPNAGAVFTQNHDQDFESFKKIEMLIRFLQEKEERRKKVLDVRQWFVFGAIEFYLHDESQKHYYEDSASLSGGEKAKLTYTILASAIAFQFGITDGSSRSLRLVIIDEVFSRIDTDNSAYALQLFKEIGVQLILVTPMDKINIVEDYIASMHITEKMNDNTSRLLELSMERYREEKELYDKR
ncbi:MAG: ATP-binding protein [Treponema sp.]